MAKAVFAGSFDPFHLGHLDIVEQAVPLFDEVMVLICENPTKQRKTDIHEIYSMIVDCCKKYPNVKVSFCSGLVADYCKNHGYDYLIRGLRNTSDYLYEENVANINLSVNPDLKISYFRSRCNNISSTLVKELLKHGKDVSMYLPEEARNNYCIFDWKNI